MHLNLNYKLYNSINTKHNDNFQKHKHNSLSIISVLLYTHLDIIIYRDVEFNGKNVSQNLLANFT